jgi:GGDEF domain-containing protein
VLRFRWKSAVGPTIFAVLATSLLIYDHLNRRVTELVFWLTLALVVTVFARMIETVRRQSGVLRQHERSALSDPVTGLENRRKLESDIDAALATPDDRRALVMLELDGLQTYSDRFGYAMGEDLLRRSALSLMEAITPLGGIAYRVDTDRLAALVPLAGRQLGEVVLAATALLRDDAADPVISRAYGDVAIPDEASQAELAFQIAGQRLAAHKQRQHRSARRQAHAVLMAALSARRPDLRDHLRIVTYRAISLARRLGLGVAEIDDIALAAELQDVGLLAVPEAVLEKERPLDDPETALVRGHTAEGERIIAAAQGLAAVAALVRASSEHFDGSGYPDGLAGKAIPLGARIIAVAVAYAATTSPRPYRAAMSPESALAELRRCAHRQFDPDVVEALAQDLAEEVASAQSQTEG